MAGRAGPVEQALLDFLGERGIASSAELQAVVGKSQPTVSRALQSLASRGVVALGRGRRTRYGLSRAILGSRLGQQPIWRHDEHGAIERWGELTWLAGQRIHVQAGRSEWLVQGELPWFLSPLRIEGYLGRIAARTSYLSAVVEHDPDDWTVEQQLYAATARVRDGPGAMTIGDPEGGSAAEPPPTDDARRALHYDGIAADVAAHLNPGSSVGGEQAKFLATRELDRPGSSGWERLVVKFTPPRGTPFGERWHDLLHAEALALDTLRQAGEPVAVSRVLESSARTYLESVRFDRIGAHGRRHAVSLTSVHTAFVAGAKQDWGMTAAALVTQRRLSADDAARVRLRLAFGRLIGNTDMHFGNLSLWADDPASGRFELAPCYDMLPMAYQPDAAHAGFDLAPLHEDKIAPRLSEVHLWPHASRWARTFWQRVADHPAISAPFRSVAAENARRLAKV